MCCDSNLPWIQGVQYLLMENGFGDVWIRPDIVNKDSFHKYFRKRLNDQHVQNWRSKIFNSNRFKIMQLIHEGYRISKYIDKIKSPEIREIYTRLRIDMNI